VRIADLLAAPEGKRLDFKRDLSSLAGVLKDVIAFANTAGGTVVVGVADDKTVVGLDDPLAQEERLASAIADSIRPQLAVDLRFSTHDAKTLLLVDVPHQPGPVHLAAKGEAQGTFVRIGSTNRKADAARLAELRRARDGRTFDELPCPRAARADLDDVLLERWFKGADDAKLHGNRLLGLDGTPTQAGIILFGQAPHGHFPDARFRCITYPGADKSSAAVDARDFEGRTVLDALEDVLAYITAHTRTRREIGDLRREEVPEYSPAILREILVNAIAHADYNVQGSRLDVSIYADRLVIQSPGPFPPGMTVEDLKAGVSQVRNRAIAKTLNALGLMEEQGTAYARIREAMAEGYPEPEWLEIGPVLRVVLRPLPITERVSRPRPTGERRHEVVAFLTGRPPASAEEIAGHLDVSKRQAQTYLRALIEEGRVQTTRPPRDPAQRYRLAERSA
jgi:ATP-dependent DNA helicase RecG